MGLHSNQAGDDDDFLSNLRALHRSIFKYCMLGYYDSLCAYAQLASFDNAHSQYGTHRESILG